MLKEILESAIANLNKCQDDDIYEYNESVCEEERGLGVIFTILRNGIVIFNETFVSSLSEIKEEKRDLSRRRLIQYILQRGILNNKFDYAKESDNKS